MIAREHREIPVELINEPDAPTRLSINPEKFDLLCDSIRERGQLQPGGVVPDGDRFTISYGHRRFLAVKRLELPTYAAYVYASDTAAMLGAQLDENVIREDLNPVEEASWFAQLLDAAGWDTDDLAQHLNKTRAYVEDRLNLLRGDPRVLDALGKGAITLGVAKLLNKYGDDADRVVLLDAAISGGAKTRLVAEWIADREKIARARGGAPAIDPTVQPASDAVEGPKPLTCLYCDSDEDVYLMVALWIHKPCLRMLMRLLQSKAGGLHVAIVENAQPGAAEGTAGQAHHDRVGRPGAAVAG